MKAQPSKTTKLGLEVVEERKEGQLRGRDQSHEHQSSKRDIFTLRETTKENAG